MKQVFIVIAILAFIVAGITGASYAVSAGAVAEFVGGDAAEQALGDREVRFAFSGVPEMADSPRAWVFHYPSTDLVRLLEVTIYVTPKGQILRTDPHNLQQRLLGYRDPDPTQ